MKQISLFSSVFAWTKADLAIKYERSLLGIAWYLVNPLATFLILYFAFRETFGTEVQFYAVYIILGIIIFNFFQNAVVESAQTVYENRFTIKAIHIDLEGLILVPLAKAFVGHVFEIALFIFIMIVSGLNPIYALWYPIVLLLLGIFSAGFVYLFSVIGVYVADLSNIILFALRLLWFVTPIFYLLPSKSFIALVNRMNPFFYFLEFSRQLIIFNNFEMGLFVISAAMALTTFGIGKYLFTIKSNVLTESI